MNATKVHAYAAQSASSALAPLGIARRDPVQRMSKSKSSTAGFATRTCTGPQRMAQFHDLPVVPGHEIVGRVKGGERRHEIQGGRPGGGGLHGGFVPHLSELPAGLEQYCLKFPVFTYNGVDKHLGGHTFGGYSASIVVDEAYILQVPAGLDLVATAPLLCAGITTYSPLRHWKVGPGQKAGIVGLGGLGHMGVKFAHAFGAHVVLFTTSPGKVDDGLRLGANEVVLSKNADEMASHSGSFDFILDCVSANHDINSYLSLLKVDGTLVLVGAPEHPLPVSVFSLIMGRRSFAGSGIGGIQETQEMLDFCAEHGIASDIETIDMQQINEAYDRMLKQDVRYRFVIDMASLKS